MRILVECYGDNLLVEKLGYVKDENHSNIGQVASRMIKYYQNERVLGIVDNDSQAVPAYFRDFKEIDKGMSHIILFFKHVNQDRYLIKINTDFEDLFLRIEKETKLKPLTKNRSELEQITKHKSLRDKKKFVQHLEAIIDKNPPTIVFLRKCIETAQNAK